MNDPLRRQARIFMVDDEPANLKLLGKMLGSRNYEHLVAIQDPRQVLDRYAAERPDLILLDINMPIMNGFEFLEEYEKLPSKEKQEQQIVVVSSSTLEIDRERAARFPSVTGYCPKPIGSEAIAELISRLFPSAGIN